MTMAFEKSLKTIIGLLVLYSTIAFSTVASAQTLKGDGWSMPKDISKHGYLIDDLIWITNIAITGLFVIMVIWMAWAVFAHNEKHEAVYEVGGSRKQITVTMAIAGGIFLFVDGNLFINSTLDLGNVFLNWDLPLNDPKHVKIEVNARQWVWQARYTGPDGTFNTKDDAITTNDIRIPVDTPVIIELGSPDVIHNLYIPNLRTKLDAVPGSINTLWFHAEETGQFEIACAQHCGQAHYKMRGVLSVLPRDEFDEWVSDLSRDNAQLYDPNGPDNWGWAWKTTAKKAN